MSKFTPGPWRISEQSPTIVKRDFREIGCEGGELICSTSGHDNSGFFPSTAEGLANALLIAAAPTMYEFVAKKAAAGDSEAAKLLESINASS